MSTAYADDPDSMVNIDCNKEKNQLLIETHSQQMELDAPYPRKIKPSDSLISMRGLMWAVESEDGTVNWHKKEIRRTCQIGRDTYVAILNGYKLNENVQGKCGAGSPDLSLTVHKNRKLIAKELKFNNSCDSPKVIESIRFLPKEDVAIVGIHNENEFGVGEVRVSTKMPLTMGRIFSER